jgi:hypothetical protein
VKNIHRILVGNLKKDTPLEEWEDNFKINLQETGWQGRYWIYLLQTSVHTANTSTTTQLEVHFVCSYTKKVLCFLDMQHNVLYFSTKCCSLHNIIVFCSIICFFTNQALKFKYPPWEHKG